ncbi:hypothetical protein BJ875DRAFT_468654 [Amylocarpus encephaloides]|uniref:Coupling of ubiquitin conjugation to ER degradation protein 1 n=1 Tax=Amylocarpus encephaloides TaxID=45428 RepID=A0A9P8C2S2_9HELO|nr:hypothetical protein BJ875DRAFT_468654 [Amylocarpus encephaloides]
MADQTINVPQLLLILLLGGLAIRYFFLSKYDDRGERAAAEASLNRVIRASETDVERVQQLFPQVPRRSIMWDLQRNEGNIAATTERVLSGRGLEVPPQSFQPLPAPRSSSSTTSSSSIPVQAKPLTTDLITRYNLKDKIAAQASGADAVVVEEKKAGQAWSQNKGERQALLQNRREEMILAARRKMEAKVKKGDI